MPHLRYPRLKGTFYADTLFFTPAKSIRGFKCAYLIGNGLGFSRCMPMELKSDAHLSLTSLIQQHGVMENLIVDNDPTMVAPALVRNPDPGEDEGNRGAFAVPSLESMMSAESPEEFANLAEEGNLILANRPNQCLITPGIFEEVGGAKVTSARDLAFAIIEAFQNAAADDDEISTEREAEADGLKDTLAMLWASENGLLREIRLVEVP